MVCTLLPQSPSRFCGASGIWSDYLSSPWGIIAAGKGLGVGEVPVQYKEKHINTCYRQPNSSAAACITSAFTLNNETFNIWTHFVPFVLFLIYFYRTFPSEVFPLASIPSCYYPLLSLEFSVCTYLLGSSMAHLFNCMSPRIRHICFYVDYAAISIFGVSGACTTFYYLRPLNTGFFLFESANLFIGGAVLCNAITLYVTCVSRHKWESAKYVIRTLAFAVPFVYANSPSFARMLMFLFVEQSDECSHALVWLFLGFTANCLSAIFNTTRVPEKYYPNVFDVFGHNHQWVHNLTTLGTLGHFWTVQIALDVRKELMPVLLDGLTLWSSVGWVVCTVVLTGAMAVWFGSQLTTGGYLKQNHRKEQ